MNEAHLKIEKSLPRQLYFIIIFSNNGNIKINVWMLTMSQELPILIVHIKSFNSPNSPIC